MRSGNDDPNSPSARVARGRAMVIGLGLDDSEGHVRFTRADAYRLVGGSERAHNDMQIWVKRILDEVEALGISLDDMTYDQYQQIRIIVDRVNEAAGGE